MSRYTNLPPSIRSLSHRNFRLYFFGHAISILGTWIQQVALAWLVYRLTGSAALLGITAFCGLIPQLIIGPLAGAWIDKQNKKAWLIGVQCIMALQAFVLAALTWSDSINTVLIISMALVLGILNSFDTPLRQSLISSFIANRADLPNALALNATLFNIGRFIGPPIAGLLLGLTSEAFCFSLNGFSFLALASTVSLVRGNELPRATGTVSEVFKEGLRYAWKTWSVRTLILTLIAVNLTASSYAVLLPIFAGNVFAGDATTLGWLWGAAGGGSFIATIFLATQKSLASTVKLIMAGTITSTLSMLLIAATTQLPWALCGMLGLGFGISICNVGVNMVLQSMVPDMLRGRIVSFFTSARFGFDALGGLFAGFIATAIGARNTILIEGIALLLFTIFLWSLQPKLIKKSKTYKIIFSYK